MALEYLNQEALPYCFHYFISFRSFYFRVQNASVTELAKRFGAFISAAVFHSRFCFCFTHQKRSGSFLSSSAPFLDFLVCLFLRSKEIFFLPKMHLFLFWEKAIFIEGQKQKIAAIFDFDGLSIAIAV